MALKELIRKKVPNWLWLRKQLAHTKARQYNRYVMPSEFVEVGEQDCIAKADLVEHYSKIWPDYTKAVDAEIERLFKRAECYRARTDLDIIRNDMRFCRFAYGFQPDEYLSFGLEGATAEVRRSYVSDIDRYRYFCQMNDVVDFVLFMDKMETYKIFKEYYGREIICVEKERDKVAFKAFVRRHPRFVKKRVDLSKGDSVALVDLSNANESKINSTFEEVITSGKHVLEECIKQCPQMAKLNASSVNTIRVITFLTREGIEIPFCFLKVGRGGSFVDNGGAGGILIGINCDTGVLETDGFDEFGNMYQEHPDSKTRFKGFCMPEWNEALHLAREVSLKVPNVRYIGWDLAHTKNGWVIVEGNGGSQMIGPQIVWQRGVKADIELIMENMNLLV